MLEFILIALPWMADPARTGPLPHKDVMQCSNHRSRHVRPVATNEMKPDATIVRPAAMADANRTDSSTIQTWLRRWENATRSLPDRSRSEQEEFRRRILDSFNEHTDAAAKQFVGRVDERSLTENFDWRIVENNRRSSLS